MNDRNLRIVTTREPTKKKDAMKLSLAAASLVLFTAACSNSDESALVGTKPPPAPASTETSTPVPTRKLVEGNVLATSPVNLIADPGFGLGSDEGGFGAFLAIYENDFSQLELKTSFDSRSPAGFGGNVAIVHPEGATNSTSEPVMLLTSFQGGAGPFRAQVWVSHSTTSGAPSELTLDTKGLKASITDETPDGEAFDLLPVDGATRTAAGRTWVLLRGEVPKALTYGGFFVIRTGTGGGEFLVAAPEIVAQPLVDAVATTKSLTKSVALAPRTKTSFERSAITRYKSRPPRLVPATPRLRRGE